MILSTKQKKSILCMLITYVILAFLTMKTQLQSRDYLLNEEILPDIGISAFFHLFNGNRTLIFLFLGILLGTPSVIAIYYFQYKNNAFKNLILTRISYKKYIQNMLVKTFVYSFCFYLALNIIVLLLVHTMYYPILFHEPMQLYELFSSNLITNVVIYIILSSLGFSIYNLFLTQLIEFIHNEFLFRGITLINFVASLIIFSGIKSMFVKVIQDNQIIDTITSSIVPINLFTPGLLYEYNGLPSFIASAIFYLLVTFICGWVAYKGAMKNG